MSSPQRNPAGNGDAYVSAEHSGTRHQRPGDPPTPAIRQSLAPSTDAFRGAVGGQKGLAQGDPNGLAQNVALLSALNRAEAGLVNSNTAGQALSSVSETRGGDRDHLSRHGYPLRSQADRDLAVAGNALTRVHPTITKAPVTSSYPSGPGSSGISGRIAATSTSGHAGPMRAIHPQPGTDVANPMNGQLVGGQKHHSSEMELDSSDEKS